MAKRGGLRRLRLTYDLTQAEISERVGVSATCYSLIETGKRKGSLDFWNGVQGAFELTGDEVWKLQNGKDI